MLTNKEIRKHASRFLLSEGRLWRMSVGVFMSIAALMIPLMFLVCLMYFASFEGIDENIAYILTEVAVFGTLILFGFFTIPMLGGYLKLSYNIYKGVGSSHPAEMFSIFISPRRYFRAIVAGLMFVARGIAVIIPIVFSFAFIATIWENNDSPIAFLVCLFFSGVALLICVGIAFLIAHLTQKQYFVPYYLCAGNSLSGAVALSKAAVKKKRFKIWGYLLGLLPICILSLLTVGVLFVVYSAPMMIFAYFIHCEKMTIIER